MKKLCIIWELIKLDLRPSASWVQILPCLFLWWHVLVVPFFIAVTSSLEIARWKLLQVTAIPNGPLYLCHNKVKLSAINTAGVLRSTTWPTVITVSMLFAGDALTGDIVTQCDGAGRCLFCRFWWLSPQPSKVPMSARGRRRKWRDAWRALCCCHYLV